MVNALAYEIPAGATRTIERRYSTYDNEAFLPAAREALRRDLEAMGLRRLGDFRTVPAVEPGFAYLWCYAGPAEAQPGPPRGHQ